MRITILPSDKGDCLLIEASDGTTVLVDGGMYTSYQKYVRPFLGKLAHVGRALDLAYISHIDQDHIAGVLQLMDDLVEWRVHDHRAKTDPKRKPPKIPRAPEVKRVWHNAFHDQVGDNAGEIESMLAAASAMLANSADPALGALSLEYREIATSIPEAITLSRRVAPEQLDIPFNDAFGGRLAMVRKGDKRAIALGSLAIRVVGPFAKNLEELRVEWDKWLARNKKRIAELRREAREDEELLKTGSLVPTVVDDQLGDRSKVTAPNLASLMLLVEESGKRVLLTGDGHPDEILAGLKHHGALRRDGTAHFEVLKVQHHGSEHNMTSAFARRITADSYIFCGNGKHGNPDTRVVDLVAMSRIGNAGEKSSNPEAGRPFTFWFNSSSGFPDAVPEHMSELENRVARLAKKSEGQMSCKFLMSTPLELIV